MIRVAVANRRRVADPDPINLRPPGGDRLECAAVVRSPRQSSTGLGVGQAAREHSSLTSCWRETRPAALRPSPAARPRPATSLCPRRGSCRWTPHASPGAGVLRGSRGRGTLLLDARRLSALTVNALSPRASCWFAPMRILCSGRLLIVRRQGSAGVQSASVDPGRRSTMFEPRNNLSHRWPRFRACLGSAVFERWCRASPRRKRPPRCRAIYYLNARDRAIQLPGNHYAPAALCGAA